MAKEDHIHPDPERPNPAVRRVGLGFGKVALELPYPWSTVPDEQKLIPHGGIVPESNLITFGDLRNKL